MASPQQVVAAFIAAIEAKDVEGALGLVRDDVSYENMPIQPIVGKEAVRATLHAFLGAATRVDWQILREVVVGNVVVNERLDRFEINGKWLELPVAGFFELDDEGRIARWRDYFDMGAYTSQLTALTKPS
jgi:limonene-1,2-epoxide hydrolase